jgi:hypothetical protein
MKAKIAAAFIVLIGLSGYAWGASEPKIDVHLEQLTSTDDMFYFRGPINIQYRLTVSNPTDQPVTLRRLELSTLGPGSYSLHTGTSPVTRTIAPHGTTSLTLSAWGRSSGGYLRSQEPVNIRGVAYFEDASRHSFVKQFLENFRP